MGQQGLVYTTSSRQGNSPNFLQFWPLHSISDRWELRTWKPFLTAVHLQVRLHRPDWTNQFSSHTMMWIGLQLLHCKYYCSFRA